ncbi:MAG: lepB [Dehalococcoidia bacterium]|nr:lepB [Dehalococcoidia bacterium]
MVPSMDDGELMLVNKLAYARFNADGPAKAVSFLDWDKNGVMEPFGEPRRGDVIVFHSTQEAGRFLVKRVIGIPGDTVEIRRGDVYSNGEQVNERTYIDNAGSFSMAPLHLSPGEYWVMGDNRTGSSDSRIWGTLPRANIVGKAWIAYWPVSHIGLVKAPRF